MAVLRAIFVSRKGIPCGFLQQSLFGYKRILAKEQTRKLNLQDPDVAKNLMRLEVDKVADTSRSNRSIAFNMHQVTLFHPLPNVRLSVVAYVVIWGWSYDVIRMLHVLQNIIKTLHGASFAQGKNILAQASHKAMHTCIRTYTYMYTYVYTYVYTCAFEVKNRIPCMSLLATRLLCAAQFWLQPVPAKFCICFASEENS